MRIKIISFLMIIAGTPLMADSSGVVSTMQDQMNYLTNVYEDVDYNSRPYAGKEKKELNEVQYMNELLPELGDVAEQSQYLQVDRLNRLKGVVKVWEEKLKEFLTFFDERIGTLWQENENYRFEIRHFLKMRRTELKELHKKIALLEKKFASMKKEKADDIVTVRDKIQKYYEEIDLHLEDLNSSFDDEYVQRRKDWIKKLMKKEMALKKRHQELDYAPLRRMQTKLEFYTQRKKEIYEQSRDLSFEYVKRRKSLIAENNAKINYIMATLPSDDLKVVRAWAAKINSVKKQIEKLEKKPFDLSPDEMEHWEVKEQARFEEEYYHQQQQLDKESLSSKRKQLVKELRSVETVELREGDVDTGSSVKQKKDEKNSKPSKQSSQNKENEGEKYRYIWILPSAQGQLPVPSQRPELSSQMVLPKAGLGASDSMEKQLLMKQLEEEKLKNELREKQLFQMMEQFQAKAGAATKAPDSVYIEKESQMKKLEYEGAAGKTQSVMQQSEKMQRTVSGGANSAAEAAKTSEIYQGNPVDSVIEQHNQQQGVSSAKDTEPSSLSELIFENLSYGDEAALGDL